MGLLELLKKYSDKRAEPHYIVFSDDASCSVRDPYMKFVVSFSEPSRLRDWLIAQTTDQSDDTKVYL